MLRVRFKYTSDLAPLAEERDPFATFYLSSDVRSEPYARVPLSNEATSEGEVALTLWRRDEVPRDATLSVAVFVHTHNRHGEPAVNQAGTARFYLADLFQQAVHKSPIRVANASNLHKGDLELEVLEVPRASFREATEFDYVHEAKPAFRRAIQQYAAVAAQPQRAFPPRHGWEAMARIHAPLYANTSMTMPGLAFASVRQDALTEAGYYENLLDIVLRRHYPRMSVDEARAHLVDEASWSDVAVVLAKMLCVYPNYCTYLTDAVSTRHRSGVRSYLGGSLRAIESFDVTARLTETGDCEDFALESTLSARDVRDQRFETPAMQRVQRVRRAYECEMVLKGVLGGSLHDAMQRGHVPFGGHMNARLTPRSTFRARLARCRASNESPFVGDPLESEIRASLPTLALEGTGMMDPYCERDTTSDLHEYLSRGCERTFSRVKRSIQQPRSRENMFYKVCQSSFLPDRLDAGYRCGEALYVDTRRRSGGVSYVDSIRDDSQVGLWLCEELSDEESAMVAHMVKHVHPVAPHRAPSTTARENTPHPLLSSLERARESEVGERWRSIDYHLRADQVSEKRVAALNRAFSRDRVRSVRVYAEPVTETLRAWMVRVWME